MKNRAFKDLVLNNFPGLTVTRDVKHPQLFVILNKNGEVFDEAMTSYSASKTWEIAYRLMMRGELKPYKKDKSERASFKAHESLPNWKLLITDQEVDALIDDVLSNYLR